MARRAKRPRETEAERLRVCRLAFLLSLETGIPMVEATARVRAKLAMAKLEASGFVPRRARRSRRPAGWWQKGAME